MNKTAEKTVKSILNFGKWHQTTELIPNNGRKSFYHKAIVHESKGNKVLQSYDTMVAAVTKDGKFVKMWDGWSATSGNHINAFADEFFNCTKINKSVWNRLVSGKKYDLGFVNAMAEDNKIAG